MSQQLSTQDQATEFLLYTTPNGDIKVEVILRNESIWLTQKRMAELFGVGVPAISKHLKNIFESGELEPSSVISILETTAEDGKSYQTQYYNLDAVISVGYRVNSVQATQFRIWATALIKYYIIKGFAPKSLTTQRFYAHVQDKFHFAITGHTSAEIIALKADF